jgi:hypothetical protein
MNFHPSKSSPEQKRPQAASIADAVRRSGAIECDAEELAALKSAARTTVLANVAPQFNPREIASDQEVADALRANKMRLDALTSRRDVLDARLTNAREQTARLPEPKRSLVLLLIVAMGIFALGFGPTVYSVFLAGIEDPLLAWSLALVIGAAAGGFLAMLLLNFEEEN